MAWEPTKARLLEAAGEEFAEKGFDGATVRSICARAGANLAAVNYHFGDKEQLYLHALMEAHRCGVDMPRDEEFFVGSPADQLRRYLKHFLTHILALSPQTGWQHQLMLRELMRPTKASETLVRDMIRPKFERLLRILAAVCPQVDERRLHLIAFSIIGQCLHYKIGRPIMQRLLGSQEFGTFDVDLVADHIASFSLAALGLEPPLGSISEPAPVAEEAL